MPDGKPTKAPLIIFGTMVTMSVISVGIVFYTHSQRTEPYLDTKMRRVRIVPRPAAAGQPTISVAPGTASSNDAVANDAVANDAVANDAAPIDEATQNEAPKNNAPPATETP